MRLCTFKCGVVRKHHANAKRLRRYSSVVDWKCNDMDIICHFCDNPIIPSQLDRISRRETGNFGVKNNEHVWKTK